LSQLRARQDRYALYMTTSYLWLFKFGSSINDDPETNLKELIGLDDNRKELKDVLQQIVRAVKEKPNTIQQTGMSSESGIDQTLLKECLNIFKANYQCIPSMDDLKRVYAGERSTNPRGL
jgi:hypothetical protein